MSSNVILTLHIPASDPPGVYKVLTSQTHKISTLIPEGYIYRINTGGPLPLGADAVIMVEDTELVSTNQDQGGALEEREVKTLAQVPPADNVRAAGSDVRKGDLVLRAGNRLTRGGGEVGTLTFVGRKEVRRDFLCYNSYLHATFQVNVVKKPSVALLSTGNELVNLHGNAQSPPSEEWGGIFDTNRPSLQSVLESLGYDVVDLGIVPDTLVKLRFTLLTCIDRSSASTPTQIS